MQSEKGRKIEEKPPVVPGAFALLSELEFIELRN